MVIVEADSILEVFSQTTGKAFTKNVVVFCRACGQVVPKFSLVNEHLEMHKHDKAKKD